MNLSQKSVTVCQGHLMSTNELRYARRHQFSRFPQKPNEKLFLCSDVSEEFFRRLKNREETRHSLSYFRIDGNKVFIVFMLQIREHQARFLLPLASQKSIEFVEQVEKTGVLMSLGRAGTRDAIVRAFIDGTDQLNGIRSVCKRFAQQPVDVDLGILKMACYSMTQVDPIPGAFAEIAVSELCLSVVFDANTKD